MPTIRFKSAPRYFRSGFMAKSYHQISQTSTDTIWWTRFGFSVAMIPTCVQLLHILNLAALPCHLLATRTLMDPVNLPPLASSLRAQSLCNSQPRGHLHTTIQASNRFHAGTSTLERVRVLCARLPRVNDPRRGASRQYRHATWRHCCTDAWSSSVRRKRARDGHGTYCDSSSRGDSFGRSGRVAAV